MAEDYLEIPLHKVVLDVILLSCVGFPILFLFLWAHPYERGFFCNDESLLHPFHESTVSSIYLYIVGLGMNCFVMILTEYMTRTRTNHVRFCGRLVPTWIWNSYCVIIVFGFGAACSQLTTDIIKYTVGRLRPHFLTVCEPNVNCTLPANKHRYIVNFECTNPLYIYDKRIIKELRLSFPSGHSSFAMYTMLYFAVYIQSRMTWDGSKLLRHTLQFLAISAAIFTGMTRISDYKHHWSDVLGGLSIGTVTACVVARYASGFFSKKKKNYVSSPTELSHINGSPQANSV
ncbi:wun [Trypoxylus dichotomus]